MAKKYLQLECWRKIRKDNMREREKIKWERELTI